ncbi:MAG: GNAT family N-acetyltransferase [Geodermatophilaceae bacterium]
MTTTNPLLRAPAAEEFPAMWRSMVDTFSESAHDADLTLETTLAEPERCLIALDGDDIVATAGIFTRDLTVPGAIVPIAGVTYVTVAPTHRRRGVLTEIMVRQLTELHEQDGEAVAALWASEAGIYQRFGYGNAAPRASISGSTRETAFRREVDLGTGRVRRLGEDKVRPHAQAVYDALRPAAVGWLDRPDKWWARRHYDPEHYREGFTEQRYLAHEERDGQVTGWASYRVKGEFERTGPNGLVALLDIGATTPQAQAALWRFLLDQDLVRRFRRRMSGPDDSLQHLVLNPRAVETEISDGLWVRLVDVDRALAARRYSAEIDIVLDVSDDVCPWNAGRWRLTAGPDGAECAATTDPADLQLTSTELGAAYLGGPSLAALALAGRVRELTTGALQHGRHGLRLAHRTVVPGGVLETLAG